MLYRWLTGKLTIGVVVLIVFSVTARYAWKAHVRAKKQNAALMARFAPALDKLTPAALADSTWAYDGPLGKQELHFNADGTLTITSPEGSKTGSWKVAGGMLEADIPGAERPHQGIFKNSTDVLTGPIPDIWSATRVVE